MEQRATPPAFLSNILFYHRSVRLDKKVLSPVLVFTDPKSIQCFIETTVIADVLEKRLTSLNSCYRTGNLHINDVPVKTLDTPTHGRVFPFSFFFKKTLTL